jgi:hypothetical protein
MAMTTRSLSARASELVRGLQQSTTRFDALVGRTLDSSTLDAIADLGEPLVAPYLIPLVIESRRESARRGASVVRTLMTSVPPMELPKLDEACRAPRGFTGLDSSPWYSMKPSAVARLSTIDSGASALLGVASFHPNGYVRAAAVEKLDARDTGEEVRYLLVRLNDWVAPVADRARTAIMRRVEASRALMWVENVGLVSWVAGTDRRDHGEVVTSVFELLAAPDSRSALEVGLTLDDRASRRICHRLVRQGETVDLIGLIGRARHDDDPIVRLEALREARARLDAASLLSIVESAEADAFTPVRREALLATVDVSPPAAAQRARRALLDRNPAIREIARFVLAKLDPTPSLADFYRAAVLADPDEASLPMALAGLGETGDGRDAVRIVPFLEHRRPAVRREAIRGLGRLDAAGHARAFIAALSDESPRVTHAARDVLRANASLVEYDAIAGAVRGAPHAHGKIDALRLAESLGKWPSLVVWLDAATSADDDIAGEARDCLERWLRVANRRAVAPLPSQVRAIRTLLDRTSGVLDDELRKRIRGFLQPWLGSTDR